METQTEHLVPGLGFHARGGWFFRRKDDGGVCLYQVSATGTVYAHTDFDAETWCSVVASVSEGGESKGRWFSAMDFHAGKSGDREGYA